MNAQSEEDGEPLEAYIYFHNYVKTLESVRLTSTELLEAKAAYNIPKVVGGLLSGYKEATTHTIGSDKLNVGGYDTKRVK